jgi:hypothetical protein
MEREPRPIASTDRNRLTAAIRALSRGRTSSLQYHMAVAKRVVDEVYGGQLEALRSEGERGPSFNGLARDLAGTISKTTLHRALWAYEVRTTTPIFAGRTNGVPTLERVSAAELERLGVSHLYEVRGLITSLRSHFLSRAFCGRWSVRRLRREIAAQTNRPERAQVPEVLELLGRFGDFPKTMDVTPLASLSDTDARVYQCIANKLHDLVLRAQAALAMRETAKPAAECDTAAGLEQSDFSCLVPSSTSRPSHERQRAGEPR